jgi:hypothetical protein
MQKVLDGVFHLGVGVAGPRLGPEVRHPSRRERDMAWIRSVLSAGLQGLIDLDH